MARSRNIRAYAFHLLALSDSHMILRSKKADKLIAAALGAVKGQLTLLENSDVNKKDLPHVLEYLKALCDASPCESYQMLVSETMRRLQQKPRKTRK
jgi:hypothetical protein